MENFRSCPICLEVPEQEIFQCSAGHMICATCISKVASDQCPQCRIPFGNPKIRNRILEEILDSQQFECKFSDKGCSHLCKRGEVTSHANSCFYNPDTVSICDQLGFHDCKFALGCVSRAVVISHFEDYHGCPTPEGSSTTKHYVFTLPGSSLMELLDRKRKLGEPNLPNETVTLIRTDNEKCPVFLLLLKINRSLGSLSVVMINVWECKQPSRPFSKHEVQFTLNRASSDVAQAQSSSSLTMTNEVINPFPLNWTMDVYSLKKALQILKWIPVSVSVSLLKETRFGANSGDSLHAKIKCAI